MMVFNYLVILLAVFFVVAYTIIPQQRERYNIQVHDKLIKKEERKLKYKQEQCNSFWKKLEIFTLFFGDFLCLIVLNKRPVPQKDENFNHDEEWNNK